MTTKSFFLISVLPILARASGTCYCKDNGLVGGGGYCGTATPCGEPNSNGFVQCCAEGDTCGADGFCHFTHSQAGTSGYYLGSCTDPSYTDESCPQACTGNNSEDVVYNAKTGLWACCYGSGGLDCTVPSSETFHAAAPKDLFAVPFSQLTSAAPAPAVSSTQTPTTHVDSSPNKTPTANSPSSPATSAAPNKTSAATSPPVEASSSPATSFATSVAAPTVAKHSQTAQSGSIGISPPNNTPTTAISSPVTTTSNPPPSSAATSDLSTGVKAAIGVVVAVVVVAAAAALAVFLLRRRRHMHGGPISLWGQQQKKKKTMKQRKPYEMSGASSISAVGTVYGRYGGSPQDKETRTPFVSELPGSVEEKRYSPSELGTH